MGGFFGVVSNDDCVRDVFYGTDYHSHLGTKRGGMAVRVTGIDKQGGIHSLRHAYATHQLDQGLPVNQLQQQLGHRDLKSTLRYLHWVPGYQQGKQVFGDLIGELDV